MMLTREALEQYRNTLVRLVLVTAVLNCWYGTQAEGGVTVGNQAATVLEKPEDITVRPAQLLERKPPARDFEVKHTVKATDHGAIPDDGLDDLAGIRAAMAKAQNLKEPTAVLLPKGTYDLFMPQNPDKDLIYQVTRNCLAFYQASNIIMDGQGSTIIIHRPTMGFLSLMACKDMIVRNLTVDWKVPPFAQGFVRGINKEDGWFEFEQTPGFLSLDSPVWQQENRKGYDQIRWGMLKDRNVPGRMKDGAQNAIFVDHWEKISENRYRMFVKWNKNLDDFEIGDPYIHVDRNGGGMCQFSHCERVTIQNITSYASPGL
jgi:hypothetical protein